MSKTRMRGPVKEMLGALVLAILVSSGFATFQSKPYLSEGSAGALGQFLTRRVSKWSMLETMGATLRSPQALAGLQNTNLTLNPSCFRDIVAYAEGVSAGRSWALSMLDATGAPSPGTLQGRLLWVGDFDQCDGMRVSYNHTTAGLVEFRAQYCNAVFGIFDGQGYDIRRDKPRYWGFCLPDSCGNTETLAVTSLALQQLGVTQILFIAADCHFHRDKLEPRTIGTISLVAFLLSINLIATITDILLTYCTPKAKRGQEDDVINGEIELQQGPQKLRDTKLPEMSRNASENGSEGMGHQRVPVTCAAGREKRHGLPVRLFLAFSLWTNGRALLDARHRPGSFTCVNGVRVFSFMWVALHHTRILMGVNSDNFDEFEFQHNRNGFYQVLNDIAFSVDSFLVMGGLLVSYATLRELKRNQGRKNWLLYFVHRYLRITPLFMVVMAVDVALIPYLTDGALWPTDGTEENFCKNSWWWNVLYIQNLFYTSDHERPCVSWLWYLGLDMQCYILSPLIVVPLFFKPVLGFLSATLFLAAATITPGILTWKECYDTLVSTVRDRPPDPARFYFIFIAPYSRMAPYVIGILLGYIFYKTNGKLSLPRPVAVLGWILATAMGLVVVFGLATYVDTGFRENMSLQLTAAYNALARTGWAVSVAWLIFCCHHGYGGFVNTFLSWKFFVPLARLCFCAYLIHPFLLGVVALAAGSPIYVNSLNLSLAYVSTIASTFIVGIIVSLCFEVPAVEVDRILFRRK